MANYNAMVIKAERQWIHGLQFLGSYTWSKAMDLTDGDNWGLEDYYKPRLSYGTAGWDRTNNFVLSGIYQPPFGPEGKIAKSDNWFNQQVIGGWRLSGVEKLATGQPIVVAAVNNADTSPYAALFANKTCNPNTGFTRTRFQIFNPACYAQPANGTYGVGGRDSAREPRLNAVDLSLAKTFRDSDIHSIEFRAEAFSVFNHPNFLAATDSQLTSPGLGFVTSATGSRTMQFALKYSF
jgi:hypothetical protein